MSKSKWLILIVVVLILAGYGYNRYTDYKQQQAKALQMEQQLKAQESKQCTFAKMLNKKSSSKSESDK